MAMASTFTFGQLLRHHRLAVGLTQEALAERARLSARGISDLERGTRRVPHRETVAQLADALRLAASERLAFEAAAQARPHPAPQPAQASPSTSLPTPLVGRTHELIVLGRHLAGEGPPLLLLAGEPGIGKTRLLREADAHARALGLTVLEGGCQWRNGQEPYAPLLGALAAHLARTSPPRLRAVLQGCSWLVRLLPELAESALVPAPEWRLPVEQERRLMFASVRRLLANVAGPAGTLLLVDDLQWAGADALDLLASLTQAEGERPLRLVGAYRETETSAGDPLTTLLANLARDGSVAHLALGPLRPADAAALLDCVLEGTVEDRTTRSAAIVRRAGGVPFYLLSCAQALRQGTAHGGGDVGAVPWDVAQTIRQRVAALTEAAQDLIVGAAVAGGGVAGAILGQITARPEAELLGALDAACRAGLLVDTGEDTYQIAHELIGEVIRGDLSTRRRRTLHRRVAEALERRAGDPPVERLAYHYHCAGDQDKAIRYLERAGERARELRAHAEAEQAYRELAERLDRLGRVRAAARARATLGAVLATRARFDEAIETLERTAATYREAGEREAHVQAVRHIALLLTRRGDPEGAIARVRQEFGDLADLAPRHRALLRAGLVYALGNTGRHREALVAAEETVRYTRGTHERPIFYQAEMRRGYELGMLGRLEEARRVLEGVLALARAEGGAPETEQSILTSLSVTCTGLGDNVHSLEYAERALEAAERWGSPDWTLLARSNCGWSEYLLGRWGRARAALEVAVDEARGAAAWATAYPIANLGIVCLAQGQTEIAGRLIEQGRALAERGRDLQLMRWLQQELAEVDLLAGRAHAARDRLEPLIEGDDQESIDLTALLPCLAWAYLELGDEDRAEATLSRSARRADAAALRPTQASTWRVHALLAIRRRSWEAAETALERALALARAMPSPYEEAKLSYFRGVLCLRRGEPQRAGMDLQRALSLCDRLGERLYAERSARVLAELTR